MAYKKGHTYSTQFEKNYLNLISNLPIRIVGGRVIYKRCSHIVELFLRIECSGEYPIYYNNQESGRPSKRRERTATPKAIIEKAFAVDSPFTITKSNLSKKYPTSQPIKVQKAVKKI